MKNLILNNKNRNTKGFSLIEILIAITIGLILVAGLIAVFDLSSRLNRTQNGLARIQENGRFAIRSMQQNISQATYQYCLNDSSEHRPEMKQPKKIPWDLTGLNNAQRRSVSGATNAIMDPGFLVHGHECTGGGPTCAPAFNTPGSDIKALGGVAPANHVDGTDILTIRYLRDLGRNFSPEFGREVDVVDDSNNLIFFTGISQANPPVPMPSPGVGFLLINCPDGTIESNVYGVSLMAAAVNQYQVSPTNLPDWSTDSQPRLFDIGRDFVTMTYYVANNVVNGRSIPTLYQVQNGVVQPLVEGVDDFDVTYVLKANDGLVSYLTADQVQNFDTSRCIELSSTLPNAGCGWRSVVAVEIHLLMNSIYNSSEKATEQFRYSQYGQDFYTVDSPEYVSNVPPYNMYRKEYYTTITLQNSLH